MDFKKWEGDMENAEVVKLFEEKALSTQETIISVMTKPELWSTNDQDMRDRIMASWHHDFEAYTKTADVLRAQL